MNRRMFLKQMAVGGVGGAIVASSIGGHYYLHPERIKSKARIVIVGAGTGGLTVGAKLAERLDGATITIVDRKEKHHYQPGSTLIACGLYEPKQVTENNGRYIPDGAGWEKAMVTEYDPEANLVITDTGKKIHYDILIVATGTQLNYTAVKGMDVSRIGTNGIGSIFHSPEKAFDTWKEVRRTVETGGRCVFMTPEMPIKCAAAPLKTALLTEGLARRMDKREGIELLSFSAEDVLFTAVKEINAFSEERFKERGIKTRYRHALTEIDSSKRIAYFKSPEGRQEIPYDYIHIVPPMSAPDTIRNSPLSWKEGPFSPGGWLAAHPDTLQHPRYANVFGIGDVLGTPIGKTAASIKKQAPVVVDNVLDMIQGKEPAHHYNGYTACCYVTDFGKAAVMEFGYDRKLDPSLPIFDPMDDGRLGWLMKWYVLKPFYFQMIQGNIPALI